MKPEDKKLVAEALLNAANILSASGTVTTWFHGGSADDVQRVKELGHFPAEYAPRQDNWGAGVYLTSSKKEAKKFGDAVIGVNVVPSVKLLDMRDPTYRAMPSTVFDKLQSAKAKAAFQKHWDKGNIGGAVRAGVLADGYDGIVWKGDDWNDWAVVFDPTQVHWRRKASGSPVQASTLTPTDELISKMKKFFEHKWKTEKNRPDLTGACVFATAFAEELLGGTPTGNWHHVYLDWYGKKRVDLTEAYGVREQALERLAKQKEYEENGYSALARAMTPVGFVGPDVDPYMVDKKFLRSRDFKDTWDSVLARATRWADEFRESLNNESSGPVSASSQVARKDNGRPRGTFVGSADGWEYTEGYPLGLRGGWAASIGLSSSNDWMNLSVEGATEYDDSFRNALREIVAEYPEIAQYVVSFDGPYIPVSELLAMKSKDFRDIVFLHGTSSAVVPRIMAEGLRPRSETGIEPAYGHASSAKPSIPDRVYLTTQLTMAKAAARNAARVHGGEPVVLEVTGLDPSYALPDEDSRTQTAEESLARLGSIAYSRTIPTSKIRAVNGKLSAATGWHGSHKAFELFDISKVRRGEFGPGFYFADDKEEAERYGPAKQYSLDIEAPLEIGNPQHLDVLLAAFPIEQRYKDLISKSSVGFETLFNLLEQKYKMPPETVISHLQALGFDGIRVDNGEQKFWVAFSPEQIKQPVSASPSLEDKIMNLKVIEYDKHFKETYVEPPVVNKSWSERPREVESVSSTVGTPRYVAPRPEPVLVPVQSLNIYQDLLNRENLLAMAKGPTLPPIHVARFKGEDWVFDGNHRVALAILRGDPTIEAWVHDLDAR